MPELPEVQTVLNGLVERLGSRLIASLEGNYQGTVVLDPDLPCKYFPTYVKRYERKGKYMLLSLESDVTIIIHLRMTGKLVFWDEQMSDETSIDHDADLKHKHQRALLTLADGAKILFIDPRTFGKIVLCPSSKIQNYLAKLGAEPLTDALSASYLQKAFGNRKLPIKQALLDQSIVAGLGNIYVCEILYRCKIHPQIGASKINLRDARSIVKHTRQILKEAIANNGTSISDYRRVDDKSGEFQNFLLVYGKKICPLGHQINTIRQGGRSTYFCPQCQRSQDRT